MATSLGRPPPRPTNRAWYAECLRQNHQHQASAPWASVATRMSARRDFCVIGEAVDVEEPVGTAKRGDQGARPPRSANLSGMSLRLSVLGGWVATLAPALALDLSGRKTQALLVYLTLHAGQPQTRGKLMTLLWADHDAGLAGQSLRRALYLIRRALGDAATAILKSDGDAVMVPQGTVEVDAAEFERLAKGESLEGLEQAVALYRGELLEGLDIQAPAFEEWLRAERERLYELAIESAGRLLAAQVAAGPAEPAIETALRLLSLDPLQEVVHRALMRLYVRQGRRTAALKQYQLCVDMLAKELGVEPELETSTLYQAILQTQS